MGLPACIGSDFANFHPLAGNILSFILLYMVYTVECGEIPVRALKNTPPVIATVVALSSLSPSSSDACLCISPLPLILDLPPQQKEVMEVVECRAEDGGWRMEEMKRHPTVRSGMQIE